MAELLIRVVDKTHPVPEQDALLTKAGDVIAVCPDGWAWGMAELTNPDWVIVKVEGVAPSALADLLEGDRDGQGRVLRRRSRQVNLAAAGIQAANARVVVLSGTVARNAFLAARRSKPSVQPTVTLG